MALRPRLHVSHNPKGGSLSPSHWLVQGLPWDSRLQEANKGLHLGLKEVMGVLPSCFPSNHNSYQAAALAHFATQVSGNAEYGQCAPPIRFWPSCPHPTPPRDWWLPFCPGCQSSENQGPLYNQGPLFTREPNVAVTIPPDAFRGTQAPLLPTSNLKTTRSHVGTMLPDTRNLNSPVQATVWSCQPLPSPYPESQVLVTVAGTDLRFYTKSWGHSQT